MDIKAKIEELVEKIKSDKGLLKNFTDSPVETVEKLIGVNLPNEQLEHIVSGIKAKIKLDDIGNKLGGIFGK